MVNHCTDLGLLMAVGMIIAFCWAMSSKKTEKEKICGYCNNQDGCVCE